MLSYTSTNVQFRTVWQDIRAKYRLVSGYETAVSDKVVDMQRIELCIRQATNVELVGKSVLEIGPGQQRLQMAYLSLRNTIVGVDLDVIAAGPLSYLKMWWWNGSVRTAKTIGRKLLGIDRRIRREFCQHIGVKNFPDLAVKQMDVRNLTFAGDSFDFVYCRSVLQHVPEPGTALRQIARVLRDDGVFFASIHLYTSQTGHLDGRIWDSSKHADVLGWQHLRPALADMIRPTAYVNRLRLAEWKGIIEREMPGAQLQLNGPKNIDEIGRQAAALQARGELLEYSLEELIHFELVAMWQKPSSLGLTGARARER